MLERNVILLETSDFMEEEAGDEEFARELASLADVYVSDAFRTCHRAHASMVAVARNFKLRELDFFSKNDVSGKSDEGTEIPFCRFSEN